MMADLVDGFVDKVVYDAEAALAAAIGEVRVLDSRSGGRFAETLAALIAARFELRRTVTDMKVGA